MIPYIPCIATVINLVGFVREEVRGALLHITLPYIPCIDAVITVADFVREEAE